MATPPLAPDFKEFLQSLNENEVRYLLIGGYAVGYYGYVRATLDMDVWIAIDPANADRAVAALRAFGFNVPELTPLLFLKPHTIVRMGVPPLRIEVLNTISGVEFAACYEARERAMIDGVEVPIIGLEHLKANKRASGRTKDLVDVEHLP